MSFIEYPKMVYRVEAPSQKIVMDKKEEDEAIKEGYQLAETFFSDPPASIDGEAPPTDGKGKKKK